MSESTLLEPVSDAPPAQSLPEPSYRRLTDTQRSTILDLYAQGHTQTAIGQLLGVDDSTINRVIKTYASSRDRAKLRIEATAEPAVIALQKLLRLKEKPDVQYKAAAKLIDANGLGGEGQSVNVGVSVVIGAPGQPALKASVVTVQSSPAQGESE